MDDVLLRQHQSSLLYIGDNENIAFISESSKIGYQIVSTPMTNYFGLILKQKKKGMKNMPVALLFTD
jgi:hypothetical protein